MSVIQKQSAQINMNKKNKIKSNSNLVFPTIPREPHVSHDVSTC